MTLRQRYLRVTNLLFVILIAVQFLPDKVSKPAESQNVIYFAIGLEVLLIIVSALIKKPESQSLFLDIVGFIFAFLILWTLATAKFSL